LDGALSGGKKLWGSVDGGKTWTDVSVVGAGIVWSNANKTVAWTQNFQSFLPPDNAPSKVAPITKVLSFVIKSATPVSLVIVILETIICKPLKRVTASVAISTKFRAFWSAITASSYAF
jgi:hypothetical protein